VDSVSFTTGYTYDDAGNLRTITYPTGQTVLYQPDTNDAAKTAAIFLNPAGTNQTLAQNITYLPFGPVTGLTYGNNATLTKSFDKNYQTDTIAIPGILSRDYAPDNVGNVTAISDLLDPSRSQNFTYDALYRLESASGVYGAIDFTYDKVGNRLTRTDSTGGDVYTYMSGTNKLRFVSGPYAKSYSFDPDGNVIAALGGQQPPLTDQADYTYNAEGQRSQKVVDGSAGTIFHFDLDGRLIAETDGLGNLVKGYIWLHEQPFAQFDAGGSVYYYHNDHLGTPQRMTDGSGAVVWAADYLPFGEADITVETVGNDLRFAGQYYDQETGLHYNYHRYYDPKLGRYLRADPIGLEGGINLYAYVENNPINDFDPFGLHGWVLLGNKSTVVRPSVARTIPRITRGMARNNPKQTPKLNPKQVFRPAPEIIKPQPKPWHYYILRLLKPIAESGVDDVLMMPPVGLPDGDSADHSNSISNQCKDSKNEKKVLVGSDAWNECTATGQCM
jgi:RHS repeat-associated protein